MSKLLPFAVFGATSLSPVYAAEPIRLKSSSKWAVDYAPDYCRLTRTFGANDAAITLIMDRFGPSDHFRLSLVGAPMRATNKNLEAKLRFGSGEQVMVLPFLSGSMGNQPAWIVPSPFYTDTRPIAPTPAAVAAAEAKIDEVFIGAPLREPVILDTGSFGPPFAALRKCTDELLTDWGLDAASHNGMRQYATPINNPATWVTDADYPSGMLKAGQQALVEFRLIIGTDGTVESCHIQQSSNPSFNDTVCAAVKRRATFNTARNSEDAPIRSFYSNRVLFRLTSDKCGSNNNSVQCAKR